MTDPPSTILDELASESGAESRRAGGSVEYTNSGQVFAVSEGVGVELRLLADIAEAARRTPDTHASSRGDDWVRFTPQEWDDHARDRLEAWFRVAWRFAGDR
jgi:hypothetical protein